jgi:hypothetical protein
MRLVVQVLGVVLGVFFLLGIMATVGVFLAFLVYLYPAFPWALRLLMVAEAAYVACILVASVGWLISSDVRRDHRWMLLACSTMFVVIWMYNGLMLHLAGSWGIELDSFSSWVLGFEQASIDWTLGIVGMAFGYAAGFFRALIDALGGGDLRLPDIPSLPDVPPVDVAGPTAPPLGDANLGPVMSWAVDSVWSLILGVISGGICLLLFRRGA